MKAKAHWGVVVLIMMVHSTVFKIISFLWVFWLKVCTHFWSSDACCISCQSHLWFDNPSNIWWWKQKHETLHFALSLILLLPVCMIPILSSRPFSLTPSICGFTSRQEMKFTPFIDFYCEHFAEFFAVNMHRY